MATQKLTELPNLGGLYAKAALGAVPIPGKSKPKTLPDTVMELDGLKVDLDNLSDYVKVTDLRLIDALPATYPFTLTTPLVVSLFVGGEFPFPAMGLVHFENVITQYRPLSVRDVLDIAVRAENLREHPKGMLFDMVSEITVGGELVWKQVSTMLSQQKTSLSGGPKGEKKPDEVPPRPQKALKVTQSTISRYAAVSGDRNPIHISSIGAKAFGFPSTIAHGMWSAATILQAIEGKLPDAFVYTVRFNKPVLIPSKINVYADKADGGWDLAVKHPKKGYPHLTATVRGL
ncbi:MaoC/PaaZ C-terminal domain-containing protein [Smaragdicoccus niigatensis]|uniref:MaoC/PaaZ C-terminal domain-containing protein n=1 Tax=Smaragdicoccus niigatensis TaxID=359359 RepID=UPI0003A72E28|nr:MaoC/PaaZ C-terminal domain-containing protein [Smaragdicoccus niigatensis]